MAIQENTRTIQLGDPMERHVVKAFQVANALAKGPVSAADLLLAVPIVEQEKQTPEAFSYLESLLPLDELPQDLDVEPVSQILLSSGLADSYTVAQRFLSSTQRIWGRDYVTLALLAGSDPSLNEIVSKASTTVDHLQDTWFQFVTSTDQHRIQDEWEEWWRAAQVPLPAERERTTDATYLFTWDPARYSAAEIEEKVEEISKSGSAIMDWSTGSRRHLSPGERVFLLRQGAEPRGLVGSGRVEGETKKDPHWGEEERKQGEETWVVPVRWDTLSTKPLVSRAELIQETGKEKIWNTRVGGVKLEPLLAIALGRLWSRTKEGTLATEAFRFAQTLSDLDHKNDWIGIRADVEALSTLIAVNRVEPPLSLAIFGDWGSGKTFLMRKIQERVQLLEQIGERQQHEMPTEETRTRYCSSILQIEFNAWHYTESNLWASLVNHIFEKLHAKLVPDEKDEDRATSIDKLFEQFEIVREARKAAQKQVDVISAEVTQAKAAVAAEETRVQTERKSLVAALGRSVWTYLDKMLRGEEVPAGIQTALEHFGFEESLESAQTIYETVEQFRTVRGRAGEVFGSLLATKQGVQGAIAVALIILLATVLAVKYQVPILSVGTTLAAILGWLAERAESARGPLEAIQEFDKWFSTLKQAEESKIAAEVAKAQAAFEERKEALSIARRQLAVAETREANATADLMQLTARDQMRRFVDERVTAQTYARHLGIISMIRQDFEDLSDFMYRDRQPGEARLVERVGETIAQAIPTVERIILYIDDLDRCQPERVVEVLEAIHLLLAFRLFIVVVAVDPRWVIQSLRKRYPHLSQNQVSTLQLPQHGDDPNVHVEATAHDYLEKIFHIPFWVKPIGPRACESLIAGYLGLSESADDSPKQDALQEDEQFHDLVPVSTARQSSITERLPMGVEEDPPDEEGPYAGEIRERRERELNAAKRHVENVEIIDRERVFIRELAPYLGNSPRRIKRYANTYRLFKSGLTHQEVHLFAAGDAASEDYRIVLVFLAIITGAPSLAPRIFSEAFASRKEFSVETLIEKAGLADEVAAPIEATNAKSALKLLNDLDITADEIETWVPRVMRHAFRLTPVNLVDAQGGSDGS